MDKPHGFHHTEIDAHTDLCVINADGTGLKRILSNVADEGNYIAASWGSG
jgi:hypothetical protein